MNKSNRQQFSLSNRMVNDFFSGANILAVNADQSISFDICEERSECLFYLQNEMRRAGITQKDIDNARKSQEMNIIEDCKKFRHIHNHDSTPNRNF